MFPWHEFIGLVPSSLLSLWREQMPWLITANAQKIVENILSKSGSDFVRRGSISVHRTATIENRAVIKGPAIIGARCLIATGSYLRGGVWSDEDCIIGPGTELKSSFVFRRSKLAHFNFVGDCIVGSDVNLEAGSIIAIIEMSEPISRSEFATERNCWQPVLRNLGPFSAIPPVSGQTQLLHPVPL
jgi:UDP-N-acetylglucosamine diphosphorylase / glucose-1-phosphate thymidylyltransferase / UDP-N-acetylgalactosamine diphosphorylase / glucosamine-1-phosphate N-acetyltransferase / galactosamine-1-phosphate N-acetyltransferase